jgi:FkbM family methyltransferase
MINKLKKMCHSVLRKSGYDINKIKEYRIGDNPHEDMNFFLKNVSKPLIFDVGANIGQSVDHFKTQFPNSTIHSFEPGPETFKLLEIESKKHKNTYINNIGLGSKKDTILFDQNSHSDMSSFLKLGIDGWGNVYEKTSINIETLDDYCTDKNIDTIHILKSDTQGYDFEVFKGAEKLMKENRIKLIYFEFIFSNMYEDLPKFNEVFEYLSKNDFLLVNFYKSHMRKNLVSWNDMMFINKSFYNTIQ